MNKCKLTVVILFGLLQSCKTNEVATNAPNEVATKLTAMGFACNQPSSYVHCRGKIPQYGESINILYRPDAGVTIKHLVFHMHGFHEKKEFIWKDFNAPYSFEKMLESSPVPMILVIPESLGKCDTYRRDLMGPAKIAAFLTEIETLFWKTGLPTLESLDTIRVSTHSGSYSTFASWNPKKVNNPPRILVTFYDRIKAVAMFDSTYGASDDLAGWASYMRTLDRLFYVAYIPQTSTANGVSAIKRIAGPTYEEVNEHFSIKGVEGGMYFQADTQTTHVRILPKHFKAFLNYRLE